MISALSNASTELTFGQLWSGNAVSAKKELDRTFGKGRLKFGVLEDADVIGQTSEEEKCLAVVLVKVFGKNL